MRTPEQWEIERRENGKLHTGAIPRKIQESKDVLAGIRTAPYGYNAEDVERRLTLLFLLLEERGGQEEQNGTL